jgi:hypothetical protein
MKRTGCKKLDKPLYHGTSLNKARDIQTDGLLPGCSPVHPESKGKCTIWVTPDFIPALWYARDASAECPPDLIEHCEDFNEDNMAIIEIHSLPSNAKLKDDTLSHGDFMINNEIPPDCLRILTPEDLRKKIKKKEIFDYLYEES